MIIKRKAQSYLAQPSVLSLKVFLHEESEGRLFASLLSSCMLLDDNVSDVAATLSLLL